METASILPNALRISLNTVVPTLGCYRFKNNQYLFLVNVKFVKSVVSL